MTKEDFYKFMHLRGYNYASDFLGVEQCEVDGSTAMLKWNNNWIAFMDALVQFFMSVGYNDLRLPCSFGKLTIDPVDHLNQISSNENLIINSKKQMGAVKCGGIEIRRINLTAIQKNTVEPPPTLKKYVFIPNTTSIEDQANLDSLTYSICIATQIVIENCVDHLTTKIADIASNHAIEAMKKVLLKTHLRKISFHQVENDYYDLLVTQDISKENEKTILTQIKLAKFIFSKVEDYKENFFDLYELEVVYKHESKTGIYVLLRARQSLPEKYSVILANNNSFNWIEDLKEEIQKEQSPNSRIYLINQDFNSGIVGFFNSIRLEKSCPNLRIFLFQNGEEMKSFSVRSKFFADVIKKDLSINIYHQNTWGTYRHLPLEPFSKNLVDDAVFLHLPSGLNWAQKSPYSNSGEITVYVVGINRADSNRRETFALEYAGVDQNETNVMGLVPSGAMATSVQPHSKLTWSVPTKWSLEQAATVPLAYSITFYSLFVQIQLSPDDSILIHNGTSDVSVAAIAMALEKKCTVYVVTPTLSEKNFLMITFPSLPEPHILIESEPFYEEIVKLTKHKGVNTVFNCRSDDLVKQSVECLAKNARFVEIGGDVTDLKLEKHIFYYNITIFDLFGAEEKTLDTISNNIKHFLSKGVIVPLRYNIFDKDNIEAALGKVETSLEKLLIKIRSRRGFFSRPDNRILAVKRTYMDPEKSYIIIGGLGGFGLELANWMISRGATKIILNGRRNIYSGYQALCLQKWRDQGIVVLVDISDTTTLEGADSLLKFAVNLAPIGGVFNSTLLLKDELLTKQNVENFAATVKPKMFSAQNVDFLSRKLPKKLDYFVVFSSIVSSLGNSSQTNYGFANSAMERLCESRKSEGLHALAVEWGPIGDVGFLTKLKRNVQIVDATPQKINSCLEMLDAFMQQGEAVVFSCVYTENAQVKSNKRTPLDSIAVLFGVKDASTLDDSKTLLNLGMDSVLAFEIKHTLSAEYGFDVNVDEIRNITVETLRNMATEI